MRKVIVGIVIGMIVGTPSAYAAEAGWRTYRGHQTGEVLVCQEVRGSNVEHDRHVIGGKRYTVTHCTGKTWGRR